jgi:integrase
MGRHRKGSPPSYRLHKQSGQAIVSLPLGNGTYRDVLLGPHDTPESRREYARVIAEWECAGHLPTSCPSATPDLTVDELILRYWRHVAAYYVTPEGKPGQEQDNIRLALRPLRRLYGAAPAAQVGPLALRTLQAELARSVSRRVVNSRINIVRRLFKWAASLELIPPGMYQALQAVPGLKKGRSRAQETPPVQPALDEHVDATLPLLPRPVRVMVELQRLTGCRPGEVMAMRAVDLNMTEPVWTYRPASHKNQHRGLDRVIFLGPRAQALVRPFLKGDLNAYLFSPRAWVEELQARRAAERKTKPTPSELKRRQARLRRQVQRHAARYDRRAYRQAVVRACDQANALALKKLAEAMEKAGKSPAEIEKELGGKRLVPRWSPLRLRHTAATVVRAKYGIEAAKVILGHSRVETSQIYAERDLGKAAEIMAKIG